MKDGKKVVSIDIFNRCDSFHELFRRLLRSPLGAIDVDKDGETVPEGEAGYTTLEFLDALQSAKGRSVSNPGAGEEKRFTFEGYAAFELACDRNPIHISMIGHRHVKSRRPPAIPSPGMSSPSC